MMNSTMKAWRLILAYTCIHTCMETYIHTYIHTYIRSHTHTHIYMYIHNASYLLRKPSTTKREHMAGDSTFLGHVPSPNT